MVMSREEFQAAFPAESDLVERKQAVGARPVQRAIVAFSNTDGGVLLIGVADDGEILGRAASPGLISAVHEAAQAAHNPGRYWIHECLVDGQAIAVVSVERRAQGFSQTSDGQVLVRRGGTSVPLIGGELLRLVSERTLERFDVTDAGVSFSDADEDQLQELQRAYRWKRRPDGERLAAEGLAVPAQGSYDLSVAGALCLLPDPARRLGKSFIEILRFSAGSSDYDRRVEIKGPVQQQVTKAVLFLMDELGTDVVVSGLRRHELPRLPEVVLREAVANAVAHRTYEDVGRSIQVEVHVDRVEITSPGGFPEPVTEQNIRDTQSARNSSVLGVLRRLRLAEDIGLGVDVIQDSMADALLDPPRFEDLGHSVRVTLPIRGAISPQERAWILEVERRGQIRSADRLLLVHAARGEVLTNASVREVLSVDSRDARKALTRLKSAGFLEQIGERGGATYVISREVSAPLSFRMTPAELEQLVLELAAHGPVTNAGVREATGLDRVEALRLLERLVRSGRLVRVGERRGTRYLASSDDASGGARR
jgi:ATP-dependent DNA helicase RecG